MAMSTKENGTKICGMGMANLGIYAAIISKEHGFKTRCMAEAGWSTMKDLCTKEFGKRGNELIKKASLIMRTVSRLEDKETIGYRSLLSILVNISRTASRDNPN